MVLPLNNRTFISCDKWLRNKRIVVSPGDLGSPPSGVYCIHEEYEFSRDHIPFIRFIAGDAVVLYAKQFGWNQQRLDSLVESGDLIPSIVKNSKHEITAGFTFSENCSEYHEFSSQLEGP